MNKNVRVNRSTDRVSAYALNEWFGSLLEVQKYLKCLESTHSLQSVLPPPLPALLCSGPRMRFQLVCSFVFGEVNFRSDFGHKYINTKRQTASCKASLYVVHIALMQGVVEERYCVFSYISVQPMNISTRLTFISPARQ